MTTDRKTAADLQKQGTREFDAAIAGKGPQMPRRQADLEADAELDEALEESFPASDPPKPASGKTGLGAPKGRRSVE